VLVAAAAADIPAGTHAIAATTSSMRTSTIRSGGKTVCSSIQLILQVSQHGFDGAARDEKEKI
jgi:hypothetical protein